MNLKRISDERRKRRSGFGNNIEGLKKILKQNAFEAIETNSTTAVIEWAEKTKELITLQYPKETFIKYIMILDGYGRYESDDKDILEFIRVYYPDVNKQDLMSVYNKYWEEIQANY